MAQYRPIRAALAQRSDAVCYQCGRGRYGVVHVFRNTVTASAFRRHDDRLQHHQDARLKDAIDALTGALDVVRALNPVAFRWKAGRSAGPWACWRMRWPRWSRA